MKADQSETEPIEFAPEVVVPQAWKLKGVGQYGSDVDVVSLDAYKELAARCESAETAALMWGRKVIELEGVRQPSQDFNRHGLAAIARALRLPLSAILEALEEGK